MFEALLHLIIMALCVYTALALVCAMHLHWSVLHKFEKFAYPVVIGVAALIFFYRTMDLILMAGT